MGVLTVGCGGGSGTSGNNSPIPTSSTSTTPSATPSTNSPGNIDFGVVGFAAMGSGTTGGKGSTSVTVSTGIALQAAIDAAYNSNGPRIIYIDGTINLANSGSLEKITLKGGGANKRLSNLSLIGVADRGELEGIGIWMRYVSNIIIRNLKIHHVKADTGEGDAIAIQGPADHIWVDHCELYNSIGDLNGNGTAGDEKDKDYYDGLFDVKYEAEYITFSWNYVHDSYKTSLVGFSEGNDNYDRKITYHHNYFKTCNSRTPLYRFGTGHVYNNYFYNLIESGINCRYKSVLRIENNHFENSTNPIGWFYAETDPGYWDVSNNRFDNCTGSQPITSTGSFEPPYNYQLDATDNVKQIVTQWAGINKIDCTVN